MRSEISGVREYDSAEIKTIIKSISKEYPFAEYMNIGKAVSGRDISALKIGIGQECVLYAGAFHGSERLTALLLIKFAEEFCFSIKNKVRMSGIDTVSGMYDRSLIIVPIVNPDGYEISMKGEAGCVDRAPFIKRLSGGDFPHWNANLRGVDINHNFNAGWNELHELERKNGYYGPGPTRFGGPRPESEPETAAVVSLCDTFYIKHAIAFHSQGEVIYWKYGDFEIEHLREMAEILATSSGYSLDYPVGISVGGGFKDWFMETYRRPAFTVEIGHGKNPLPISDFNGIYRKLREMLVLGTIM